MAQFVSNGYTVTCAGANNGGGWLLQVTTIGKTAQQAQQQALKNVLQSVLFDGFSGTAAGCITQQPIVADKNVAESHRNYFEELFASEDLKHYITVINAQAAPPVKTRSGYKITVLLAVDTDSLRRRLERDGVIRGLSSNFQP